MNYVKVHKAELLLRHLFATRAIESGIDVPTVSRWLGLAIKTEANCL
jgi:hypothetical protein